MPILLEEAKTAKRSILKKGSPLLAKERGLLFRRILKQRGLFTVPLKQVYREIDALLKGMAIGEDGFLSRIDLRKIESVIKSRSSVAVRTMQNNLKSSIESSIKLALKKQNSALKEFGNQGLSEKEINSIAKSHSKSFLKEEFPIKSGVNASIRLKNQTLSMRQKIIEQSKKYIQTKDIAQIRKNIRMALISESPGATPIKGGSSLKQMNRIFVAEQTRKVNDAVREGMKKSGEIFVYWRIDPSHPWYGGNEICEVLANQSSGTTVNKLRDLGISTSSVDLSGLYHISDLPEYPHPFCRCHQMPSGIYA